MSDKNNRDYYAARAVKALELADAAKVHHVANIHRTMAALYEELASVGADGPPELKIVSR